MLKILKDTSSSGTARSAQFFGSPFQEEGQMQVGVWNTAEVTFVPLPPADTIGRSPRPLSALADLAVDLGPADLSETFRTRG